MIPLLVFAWLISGAVLCAAERGASCHPVEADMIYGRDLAAAVPALSSLPPDAPVGHAPVPGMERVFAPPELRRLAREHHLDPGGFLTNVCFVWRVVSLTATVIEQAMEKALTGRNPQIEIISWSLAATPHGELVFPLNGLSAQSNEAVIWKGYVTYGQEKHFPVWANVRVSIGETHLVLDNVLRAGDEPARSSVHIEAYRGALQRERALTDVAQLANVVSRRDLAPGTTLVEGMFETPLDVRLGELVAVLVESGAARIETQGVTRQAGRRGEIISVINPKTGRVYRCRVEGKSLVTVVPGGAVGLVGDESKEKS